MTSLGVHEHWNNEIDKQYSRNLGTGDGIELLYITSDPIGTTYNLTITADPIEGGSTQPDVGTHSYESGTQVEITAVATEGYIFDYWSGDCSGSEGCSLLIDSDKAVTAHFTEEKILGDVDESGDVNSTDALIILSADVGIDVSIFCPINCGDVNQDGLVNSTDALIILSYDVGIPISFDLGLPGCPSSITQPPGCSP